MKYFLTIFSLLTVNLLLSQITFFVTNTAGKSMSSVEIFKNKRLISKTDHSGNATIFKLKKGDTVTFIADNYFAFHYVAAKRKVRDIQPIRLSKDISMDPMPLIEDASFPGGKSAMNKWLSANMRYPKEAIDDGIDGKCYVAYTILSDGTVTNVRILRGVPDCPECDLEVKRAFSSMPKWNPQKDNGKAVVSHWQLPIVFGLH